MREVEQPHGGKLKIPEKGETNNPNGRPKKSFRVLNDALKKEGYEPLKKRELIDFYELVFNLDEDEVKKMASDKSNPLAIRLMIQEMTDPMSRGKAIQDYRNYAFGGAVSNIDHTTKGEKVTAPITWIDANPE
jgi:hypothetical protein